MTDYSDLLTRLSPQTRIFVNGVPLISDEDWSLRHEAADALNALTSERDTLGVAVQELREALDLLLAEHETMIRLRDTSGRANARAALALHEGGAR